MPTIYSPSVIERVTCDSVERPFENDTDGDDYVDVDVQSATSTPRWKAWLRNLEHTAESMLLVIVSHQSAPTQTTLDVASLRDKAFLVCG